MKKLILLLCIINIHSNALKKKLVILGSAFGTFVLCTGFFQWHKSRSLPLQDLKTEKTKWTKKTSSSKDYWGVQPPSAESKILEEECLIPTYPVSIDNYPYKKQYQEKTIPLWGKYLQEHSLNKETTPHQSAAYPYVMWLQKKICDGEKHPLSFFVPSFSTIFLLSYCTNLFLLENTFTTLKEENKLIYQALDLIKSMYQALRK